MRISVAVGCAALAVGLVGYGGAGGMARRTGNTLVQSFCEATTAACAQDNTDPDPQYTALMAWLRKGGARFHGVSAARSLAGGGRALIATTALEAQEHLFTIPVNFWFSEDNIPTGSAVGRLLLADEVVLRHCGRETGWGLILALDYERHNPYSPWRVYLDNLPDPTSPIVWSAAAVAALQSPQLIRQISLLRRHIRQKYEALFPYLTDTYPEMFQVDEHTIESFTWAALTVWGRGFDLGNATTTTWGMVPFADFANHAPYANNEYSMDSTSYDFAAPETRNLGQEIFISYGENKTTYHFLQFYGFVPQGSEVADYIVLSISKSSVTRLVDRLEASGTAVPPEVTSALGNTSQFVGFVGVDGRVSDEYMRLFEAASAGTGRSITAQLLAGVRSAQKGLQTALVDDVAALAAKSGQYDDESVALAVRIRFKQILVRLAANLEAWETSGRWAVPRDDRSIVYHFQDSGVGLKASEAASEALFNVAIELES